jgi:hypothetical protein
MNSTVTFAKLLVVLLILLVGCARLPITDTINHSEVCIAYGHRTEKTEFLSENAVAYQLDALCRGRFLTNDLAYVEFYTNSLPESGLPTHAILILQYKYFDIATNMLQNESLGTNFFRQFSFRYFVALGGDAYRGILLDTEENRNKTTSLSSESLANNSWWQRISKRKAIRIAEQELAKRSKLPKGGSLQSDATRYSYGWSIITWVVQPDGSLVNGDERMIRVGDDGLIKGYERGL